MRQVERPVRGEPRERLVARRVEHDAPAVHEEHAVDVRERPCGPLLRDEDRARQALDEVEERLGRLGIELRGRLVEQQQLRPQRERGRERDALQLAARELAVDALGELPRRRRARAPRRRAARSPPRVVRRRSRARTRPRSRPSPSRSGPPDPGRPTRRFPRAGRAATRACRSRRRRRARRRRRRGNAARGRRARAAASTCRSPTGRAARRARPRRARATRRRAPARRPCRRSASPATAATATVPPRQSTRPRPRAPRGRAATTARCGARVRPGAAVAARLHRLCEVQPALERAGEERRELAHRPELDPAPAQREPGALARRARAAGRARVASATARVERRAQPAAASSRSWSSSSA